ncbi:MAG: hypothetical protein CMH56_04375 [Myxococcales bacterium]|nr:hypothetical protein [Myxococcales bacterium]
MRTAALFSCLCCFIFHASAQAWSVTENWGAGPTNSGRAQIPNGLSNNLDDTYLQPAQLATLENIQVNMGLLLETPMVDFTSPDGVDKSDQWNPPDTEGGMVMGMAIPLGGVLKKRVVFGMHLYFPAQQLLSITGFDPSEAFMYRYEKSHRIHNASMLGIQLTDWLSVGAGFRFATHAFTDMVLLVDPFDATINQQRITIEVQPVFAPMAGVHLGAFNLGVGDVSFSAFFHEKMQDNIDVLSRNNIDNLDVTIDVLMDVLSNFGPRRAGGVLSFKSTNAFVFTASADWEQWSAAIDPSMIIAMDFSGADLEQLGLDEGLDMPGAGLTRNGPVGFVDTYNWGFGFETPVWNKLWKVRGGWKYRPTPIPDQTNLTNMVDNNTHIGAMGITWHLNDPMSWSEHPMDVHLTWQGHFFEDRTTTKKYSDDDMGDWKSKGAIHATRLDVTYRF